MAEGERSLTIFGWVVPGASKKRSASLEKSQSRSSSILQNRKSREQIKNSDFSAHRPQKSVTVIEGKKNLILYVEEDGDEEPESMSEKKVTLEVDYAASGIEG